MDNNNLYNNNNKDGFYNEENTNGDIDDGKRGRRSKNDNDGRTHKCQTCGKCYLSYPALYTHIKTKHSNGPTNTNGRGRGRPKKDNGDMNTNKILFSPLTADFFKHPERTGITDSMQIKDNIEDIIKELFLTSSVLDYNNTGNNTENNNDNNDNNENTNPELKQENNEGDNRETHIENNNISYNDIEKFSSKIVHKYEKPEDHPFYQEIISQIKQEKGLDSETNKCDEVFAEYIVKSSKFTNVDFLYKLSKYVFLFRECLNNLYKDKVAKNELYSMVKSSEDAPDVSNEFVSDFLETENNGFDFTKDEAIDLTQNFCQWMYDNNYTCSKLSIISTA